MTAQATHGPEHMRRLGQETTANDLPWKVAFIRGRPMLAALCANGRLRLISLQGGKERSVSVGTSATAIGAAVTVAPDGAFLLVGKFCVEPETGKKLWTAKKAYFQAAVITPDGQSAVAGCYRVGTATGEQTGYLLETERRHTGSIRAVAMSRDGEVLATGDSSGNVVLTSLSGAQKAADAGVALVGAVLAGGSQDVSSATRGVFRSVNVLAFGHEYLAVGGEGPEIRLLSPLDLSLMRALPVCARKAVPSDSLGSAETRGLAFGPDGKTLVAATNDPDRQAAYVQVWNTQTGAELMRVTLADRLTSEGALALSDDGSTIALALATGVYVCDMPDRE